jgi:hypothetical protein
MRRTIPSDMRGQLKIGRPCVSFFCLWLAGRSEQSPARSPYVGNFVTPLGLIGEFSRSLEGIPFFRLFLIRVLYHGWLHKLSQVRRMEVFGERGLGGRSRMFDPWDRVLHSAARNLRGVMLCKKLRITMIRFLLASLVCSLPGC